MSDYPLTDAGLLEALRALGRNGNQVHDTLLTGGHRGERDNECRCPIAAYLMHVFGIDEVYVCPDRHDAKVTVVVTIFTDEGFGIGYPNTVLLTVQAPWPVAHFAYVFDQWRQYDDLVAPVTVHLEAL